MPSTLLKCTCKHEFQDKRYGAGMRVANFTAKEEARCTACGSNHRVTNAPRVIKKNSKASGGGAKIKVVYPPPTGWPGGTPEANGYRRIGGK